MKAPPLPVVPKSPRPILVVEPNTVSALVAKDFLEVAGVPSLRAVTAAAAVSGSFGFMRPRMLLLQCRLGGMGAKEAVAEIRRLETVLGMERLPIIGVTADTSETTCTDLIAAGIDALLHIPFDSHQLLAAIARLEATREPPGRDDNLFAFLEEIEDVNDSSPDPEGVMKH